MNNSNKAMPIKNNLRSFFASLAIPGAAIALAVSFTAPAPVSAAALPACTFVRDIGFGTDGNDVKCLQQFLNATGFTVSLSGAGSPGKETTTFREKMQDAVILWQISNNLMPATGNFGPKSREKYKAIVAAANSSSAGSSSVTPSPTTVIPATGSGTSASTGTSGSTAQPSVTMISNEVAALQAIDKVRKDFSSVASSISKAKSNDKNTDSAQKLLDKANAIALEGLFKFIAKDYTGAISKLKSVNDYILDIQLAVKSSGKKNGLTFAKATIYNNDTVVRIKFDGEEYVFTTRKVEKDGIVLDALDHVDDSGLDKAELRDMLEIKEVDRNSTSADKQTTDDNPETAAQDAIDSAEDYVSDARADLKDSDVEGSDLDDAEELVADARQSLRDAKDAFDDEDYDEAEDLAQDAIKDAKAAMKLLN